MCVYVHVLIVHILCPVVIQWSDGNIRTRLNLKTRPYGFWHVPCLPGARNPCNPTSPEQINPSPSPLTRTKSGASQDPFKKPSPEGRAEQCSVNSPFQRHTNKRTYERRFKAYDDNGKSNSKPLIYRNVPGPPAFRHLRMPNGARQTYSLVLRPRRPLGELNSPQREDTVAI